MSGLWRFGRAILPMDTLYGIMDFGLRCDSILMSYLRTSLLESLIVGFINAIFMFACRMQYVGLVSMIVAVTNLIPNFGPIIGAVVSGFILCWLSAPCADVCRIQHHSPVLRQLYPETEAFLQLPRRVRPADPGRRHCTGESLRRDRDAAVDPRRRNPEFYLP